MERYREGRRLWMVTLLVLFATAWVLWHSGCSNPAGSSNGVKDPTPMVLIRAAGDSFEMGDGTYGPNPTVSQSISYDFYVSRTEITNEIFAEFIADGGYTTERYWTTNGWARRGSEGWTEPATWADAEYNQAEQPVVGVSWYEAVAFCNWLSEKQSLVAAYDASGRADLTASGYRLPTEVEWEYAAAKGASGLPERLYAIGDVWDGSKIVCSVDPESSAAPAVVGSRSPGGDTPQGLVDMNGNVWEWLSDNYQNVSSISAGTDTYHFLNDDATTTFLERGGGWYNIHTFYFCCSYRTIPGPQPQYRSTSVGFRIVRRAD
ncbi:MAG: SUMF1/EgtB/PvdO family nonheme iron enzyme [Spirochaetales bacterium]|nr:SUMF1/EgtB/PvdO family nonheme iron enzyme [Spirochaetales bacterium]